MKQISLAIVLLLLAVQAHSADDWRDDDATVYEWYFARDVVYNLLEGRMDQCELDARLELLREIVASHIEDGETWTRSALIAQIVWNLKGVEDSAISFCTDGELK